MTYNERMKVMEDLLIDLSLNYMDGLYFEDEERFPDNELSIDDFLSEYDRVMTREERERGQRILDALDLIEYI